MESDKLGPCPLCGALAAQNKRMREALERCAEQLGRAKRLIRGHHCEYRVSMEAASDICEEALKP